MSFPYFFRRNMTFSNHINTSEDDEFIREFPIPSEDDYFGWVKDGEKSCCNCKYYDNNPVLPCAVNPEYIYDADNCQDYSKK